MGTRVATMLVVAALVTAACGGGGHDVAGEEATGGFEPVRVGASGFPDGAPQPATAGRLSVTKTSDGATFFARVEAAGGTHLPEGENARFRLASVVAPGDGECLAGASTTHLRGAIRGAQEVRFVLAGGADVEDADEDGIPVHVWSRGIWINGEVLARGYGRAVDDGEDRRRNVEAAQAFAREGEEGIWNPALCEQGGAQRASATLGGHPPTPPEPDR